MCIRDRDEEGDLITVTQVGADPLHGTFNLFDNGTFNYNHDGTENFNGIFFDYNIQDAQCGAPVGPFRATIIVQPVNECPLVNDHNYGGVNEGGTIVIVEANGVSQGAVPDTDPDGDNLTAQVVLNPQFGTLICPPLPHPNGTGQPGICQDGSFSYTHDGSENHTDTFTYGQNDGNGCTTPR